MEIKAGEGRAWARGPESEEAGWGQEGSLQETAFNRDQVKGGVCMQTSQKHKRQGT